MVKIQALKLVPGVNCSAAARARTAASCTRSSARPRLRVSDLAKARRCGMLSTSAARNSGDASLTIVSPIRVVDLRWRQRQARAVPAGSSFRGGLSPEFVDQLQEFLGQRFADHLRVELVELSIEPTVGSRRVRFMELFHLV